MWKMPYVQYVYAYYNNANTYPNTIIRNAIYIYIHILCIQFLWALHGLPSGKLI